MQCASSWFRARPTPNSYSISTWPNRRPRTIPSITGNPQALPAAALDALTLPRELALAQRLGEFPEMLVEAGREFAPHMVSFYLRELAGEFHSYYNAERILVADEQLKLARLALILAVRQVLQIGLALLGVSAPEKM